MATHFKSKAEPTPLPERIARARREGRSQQALELTRQLHKQEPTPEHKSLLREVTLERGEQLARQGHLKDAVQVFTNALNIDDTLATKLDIAVKLAKIGTLGPAVGLARALADSPEKTRLFGAIVDGAMKQGSQGKAHLPAELHPPFDAIWQAFAHVEKGEDEAARAILQNIGLTSPFLEWKVLLRGLMAYYAHDDLKARDNWQRLDPQRTPYSIAGVFRLGIDPEFRKLQSPEHLKAVQATLDKTCASGIAVMLRNLQAVFVDPKRLADALRMAVNLIPALKKEHPHLVPRLALCFFWAIIQHGHPDHLNLFLQAFDGAVEDSRNFDRLQALASERHGVDDIAHKAWLAYDKHLEANVARFPPGHANHMRALLWEHVGILVRNAEKAGSKHKFKPNAEACFKTSIKLLPTRLKAHAALFDYLLDKPRGEAKAITAGKALLKHFPDHAPALEIMGDLMLSQGDNADSLQYYQRATQANPLERRLRNKLGQAFFAKAMDLALESRIRKKGQQVEDFRPHIEKALALVEGTKTHLLCRWSFLERKHGDEARAQDIENEALAAPHQRLAVRYALLCEAARNNFKPAQRKPFLERLVLEIQSSASADEVLALLETAALERVPVFTNQKAIEKNARDALRKFDLDVFSESQLEALCLALRNFDAMQLWDKTLKAAKRRFRNNPFFLLSEFDRLEVRQRTSDSYYLPRQMRHALDRAGRMISQLPREQQEVLVKQLKNREEVLQELENTLGALFANPFFDLLNRRRPGAFNAHDLDDDDFDDEDFDDDEFF